MSFEQATIKVEKDREYSALQAAVERAFAPAEVERFLKAMERKSIRIRDFDGLLQKRVLESFGTEGLEAQTLYQSLTTSDQALLRELYLSKLEAVDVALRHKFKKLYQYY